ncbi:MAG: threonine synthase [Steroidobacterales bacterium]|jgi:threonine synthase
MTLFASTRDASLAVGFSVALMQGLAPDGGLFVPIEFPRLTPRDFNELEELPAIAARLLTPFVGTDPLTAALPQLTARAFAWPALLQPLDEHGRLHVLELFHGPTAAFKDFGAQFLAACFASLDSPPGRQLTILVATSGDTGAAVASAFFGRPDVEVAVLFPKGLVSPAQERQLTCWGGNVRSLAVRGTFDDCQRMVKSAFADAEFKSRRLLSSANSINLGRLLPQMAYFAAASLEVWRRYGEPASFIVPSGNLGNALACLWARAAGLPVGEVVLAHNANRTVPDYLETGAWRPRPSIATLASAMDVGDPSNAERLRELYPDFGALRGAISACSVRDEEIRARISAGYERYGQIWCPHTATAADAYERLPEARRAGHRWVIVSTAHPAKFPEIVAPLIGRAVPVPQSLAKLFAQSGSCVEIAPDLGALRGALKE